MPDVEISPAEARRYLTGQLGLNVPLRPGGAAGVRALLVKLRCIQLDPLDKIGTNADLVAVARIDRLKKGDVYSYLLPDHAFEHFAKERCLLPPSAFPYYRERAAQAPWWRLTERLKRLSPELIDDVLAEIRERGPITPAELTDRGRVKALDWSGWLGTSRAATMAIEVLWTRCQVVVCGRTPGGKRYDVPERALPGVRDQQVSTSFGRWGVLERVEAAGLLSTAGGPWWSVLSADRTSGVVEELLEEGLIQRVRLPGTRRRWLAPAGFMDRRFPEPDDRMRILGPLDPLIWDRKLVELAFGFEYVWEVYKPAAKRRWGWYVCPLLHRGELVGRIEAHMEGPRLVVDNLWEERRGSVDRRALRNALRRHARAMG